MENGNDDDDEKSFLEALLSKLSERLKKVTAVHEYAMTYFMRYLMFSLHLKCFEQMYLLLKIVFICSKIHHQADLSNCALSNRFHKYLMSFY